MHPINIQLAKIEKYEIQKIKLKITSANEKRHQNRTAQ